jgi:hypothetical protein
VAIGNDSFIVLDTGDRTLKTYSINGRLLNQFGREGMGPGEFLRPLAITASDNHLYVADAQLMRITEFTLIGRYSRSFSVRGAPSDLVVHKQTLYVRTGGATDLLWSIPLDAPDEMKAILSWTHPLLKDINAPSRGIPGNVTVAGGYLVVSIPALTLLALIDLRNESQEIEFVQPKSEIIDEYWAQHEQRIQRAGRRIPLGYPIYNLSYWDSNNVVLELTSPDRSKYNSIAIVIDIHTGLETGWSICSPTQVFNSIQFLDNGKFAWLSSSTSELFIFPYTPISPAPFW